MNTQQMIDFAREQLEIFSPTCQMGTFLQCVIDKLDKPTEKCQYDIGNIIKADTEDVRAVILDNYNGKCDRWYVLTELGCVENWYENYFHKIGYTDSVKKLMETLR